VDCLCLAILVAAMREPLDVPLACEMSLE
jgi:hypothetical protein